MSMWSILRRNLLPTATVPRKEHDMARKKKLHSLLAILCAVTLLVTGVIGMLILELAKQSTQNFESFIIESRQQEISSAVHSFCADVDTLRLLMLNELEDNTLVRLQMYYDSAIFNYNYFWQADLVQRQISIIQNSMSFVESVDIYMPDSARGVSGGSIFPLTDAMMENVRTVLKDDVTGICISDGKMQLYLSRAPLPSSTVHNAVIVATFFSRLLYRYLLKYLPDHDHSLLVVYPTQGDTQTPFTMSGELPISSVRGIGEAVSVSDSGSIRYDLAGEMYLLNWECTPSLPLRICQLTPMSLITDQMREYRRMIMAVCIASAVALLAMAGFLQCMVHKPVTKINSALGRVGRGELAVRLTDANCKEFEEIYDHFNQMTERLQELIDREYALKLLNAKSELKQLRYQIRPHFLYNTYFNLRALLMNEEYEAAEQMMDVLGRYLRYITTSDRDEATLRDELAHAAAYMDIQKMRFGARLNTRMEPCPPQYADKPVPRIIVQPLIENAFEHGIRDMKDTGVIAVSFEAEGNRLSIFVDDNGPNATDELIERTQAVLDEASGAPMGDSVALSNIHRRICILYDPGSGLYISRSPLGGFRSEIRMIGEKKHASADDR